MKVFFVTKRLAFGSAVNSPTDAQKARDLGITHVINLRWHRSECLQVFCNLWLAHRDDLRPRANSFYKRALSFYKCAMKSPGSKVMAMCHHGYRRSPSLVYFFLRADGLSPAEARKRIKATRRSAQVAKAYRDSGERFLAERKT